jgi:single-strand DNA-binding protein
MSFEIVGKLLRKYPTESKSDKFQAREFVIEIQSGTYPEFIKFQLTQERCSLLDSYNEGEEIKVHFELRGREWQGKYFTNLTCWRIEHGSGTEGSNGGATTTAPPAQKVAPKMAAAPMANDSFPTLADEPLKAADTDDLPF